MDLKELNLEYQWLKERIAQSKSKLNDIKEELATLEDYKLTVVGREAGYRIQGDKVQEQEAQKERKEVEREITRIQNVAKQEQEEIKKVQEKIDKRMEQIRQDPEMREHIDEVLEKRYARKINSLEKERQEKINQYEETMKPFEHKVAKLAEMQTLLTNHPEIMDIILDMSRLQVEIEDYEQKLASIHPESIVARDIKEKEIPRIQNKYAKKEKILKATLKSLGTKITANDIAKTLNQNQVQGKDGIESIQETVKKNLEVSKQERNQAKKSCQKQIREIKRIERAIQKNTVAMETVKRTRKPEQVNRTQQGTKKETKQNTQGQIKPESKLKWWQFMARWERYKTRKLTSAEPEPVKNTPQAPTKNSEPANKNQFFDSLKFEIVRDMVAKDQKELYNNAKVEKKKTPDKGDR